MIPSSSVNSMSNLFIDIIALPSQIEFDYELFYGFSIIDPAIFFKSKCGHFWGNIRTNHGLSPHFYTVYYCYHKNEKYCLFSEGKFGDKKAFRPVRFYPFTRFIRDQFVKCGPPFVAKDDDVLIFSNFINYIYSGFDLKSKTG